MKLNAKIDLLLLFVLTVSMAQQSMDIKTNPEKYQAILKDDIRKFGFHRYVTKDKFERQIHFYISKTSFTEKKLPLVVCIQGSGCQSVFLEVDVADGKRIASGGLEAVVTREIRDRVRVLVVEKPGVELLKQPSNPGRAEEASEEYNREFSLDRWVEAMNASLFATIAMPNIESEKR